ncbi:hypothetical protein L228DRAFT_43024 [Xylona heveae TC161]|uniref:Uncharacterized protein n=1 Tax=Xylona heveae (strain CBS 132557 / TC161) TaxID=1328760 RepID=A0A164ZR83_XYLHT|nr:hypothetical protein L228DRAFT_43024 [Xylona heveae TC161]KZF19407.1 hypothetical protein L228DRAFT_43024 [Xylona heveae TC161]
MMSCQPTSGGRPVLLYHSKTQPITPSIVFFCFFASDIAILILYSLSAIFLS